MCELIGACNAYRVKRNHPALKHGAYSATAVLPGESQADFEKLHRDLIAEYAPSGVHEEHIVMKMARLIWRLENLETLHIAQHAKESVLRNRPRETAGRSRRSL